MAAAAALLVLTLSAASAERANPVDKASRGSFTAIASLVTDPDWRAKWNSPQTPRFHTPGVLRPGQKVWLLTLFSGATLKDGQATITCDFAAHEPDNTIQKQPAQPCFQGPTPGPRETLYLTGMEVEIDVAASDTPGIYTLDIGVKDDNSGVRIPLRVTYEVDPKAGGR